MRNTWILLFLTTFQLFADDSYSQNTKLTLNLNDVSVEGVLNEIESQSEFYFLFNYKLVDVNRHVDIQVDNEPVSNVLASLFYGHNVDYVIVDRQILLSPSEYLAEAKSKLQPRTITGTVTDEEGNPLVGVAIVVKGTTVGVITDINGNYEIQLPEDADILVFSYIGMMTKEISIGDQAIISVTMEAALYDLEEVVAVGYGTTRIKDLTGSVSVIEADNIVKMATPQVGQLLQGRAAGMQVANSDQAPGAELEILIRGSNSITGNNAPLIVVDGVIGVDIQSVNPSDIQSIQVLKDASSTAIYGSRGANGVIIIETKRGKAGRTNVSISTYYGIQTITKKLDLLTAEEQYNLINIYQKTQNPDPSYEFINSIDGIENPVITGKGTDWQDVIFQSAPISNTYANVYGGTERTQYLLSVDYLTQTGVIKESAYEKGSVRFNFDQRINDWLTVGNNFNYFRSKQNRIRENTSDGAAGIPVTMAATQYSPIIPVYAPDGSFNKDLYAGSVADNPMAILKGIDDVVKRDYIIDNLFAEAEILDGLKFKTSLSYIVTNTLNPKYISKDLYQVLNVGRASISSSFDTHTIFENTLSYNKLINEVHRLNAVVGFTTETESYYRHNISTGGFATEALQYYNIALAESVTDYGSTETYSTLVSTLGRINYSFKDKYLITLTARADGSSKFAKNNKWAFFPSGSVAWRLSEEEFIKNIAVISNAKIRASYGSIGSQAISPYSSLSSYSVGSNYQRGNANFSNGALPSRIANTDLRWETTTQVDVGMDLGLFNRLNFIFDVYSKETNDLLYNKTVSYFTGYTTQLQNIGSMKNSGVEADVNALVLNGNLKWSIDANIAVYHNEVLDLGGDTLVFRSAPAGNLSSMGYHQAGALIPGESISSFYGYVWDGIFQSQAEVDALQQSAATVGGVKFKDLNGDGIINNLDRKILGTGIPKFTIGFGTNLSYKGFDLNILVQGVFGNDIAYIGKYYLEVPGSIRWNSTRNALDYWTPENHSNTMQALGIENGFGYMSSRAIEDGSFVRLKNVSLGYTLPGKILDKLRLSNLRFYVSAQNLLTITDYSGFDPEINSGRGSNNSDPQIDKGFDLGGYPGVKQVNVGLNLSF